MPKGIYDHSKPIKNYAKLGPKPICDCGTCRVCRHRIDQRRHYWSKLSNGRGGRARGVKREDDKKLEKRLIQKFKEMGWD